MPWSTPAGMVTFRRRVARIRPLPPHTSQGVVMTSPRPWQRGQVLTLIIEPRKVWRTERTSPVPLQSGQREGVVPGAAPLPLHSSQLS